MMKRRLSALLTTTLLASAFMAPPAHASGSKWNQVADDDDVTAWTQTSGDGLPLARAATTLDAPFCDVLAVIRDVERYCEWMADCVATRVLHRHDWPRIDMYLRIKGYPWVGVADRDTVLETVTIVEKPGRIAEVRFSGAGADHAVLADDTVHMPHLTGAYLITRRSDGKTDIDYRFHADLGGWVPGWVGTKTVEQLPHRTLVNLRKHMSQIRGTYHDEVQGWPTIDGNPPCLSASPAAS